LKRWSGSSSSVELREGDGAVSPKQERGKSASSRKNEREEEEDARNLLIPEALEVVRVLAPAGEKDFERCSWRGSRDGEVLQEGKDRVELLVDEVGEGKDEALYVDGTISNEGRRQKSTERRT
jgi:hypothetical protein